MRTGILPLHLAIAGMLIALASPALAATSEFNWVTVSGCDVVGSTRLGGPIIITSPTKGHRYMFGKGRCPSVVDVGGPVKIYKINAAYPYYQMIKVVETDGTQWWIRRGKTGAYTASKRKTTTGPTPM